jgi:hypothetical protein
LLIVYFAGFATAIYCLAPVPENVSSAENEKSFWYSALKSDEFAHSFNTGMHKCIDFGKTATRSAERFVRDNYDQSKHKNNSCGIIKSFFDTQS